MTLVTSGKVTGQPASLSAHWSVIAGYLAGANLKDANLNQANLTDAELRNATLLGAETYDIIVTGAIWGNTTCPDGTGSASHVEGCFSPAR